MRLDVVYSSPLKGKEQFVVARASGYLEKSQHAESKNVKAIADIEAEVNFTVLDANFDSTWCYINTELIDARWVHHYCRQVNGAVERHVWLIAK